jgi:hypothetical protein
MSTLAQGTADPPADGRSWVYQRTVAQPQDDGERRDAGPTAIASDHAKEENSHHHYWQTTIWANGIPVVLDSRQPQPGLEKIHQVYENMTAAVLKATQGLPPGECTVTIRTDPNNPGAKPSITVKHEGATPAQLSAVTKELEQTVPGHIRAERQALDGLEPTLQELGRHQALHGQQTGLPRQRIPRPMLTRAAPSDKPRRAQGLVH